MCLGDLYWDNSGVRELGDEVEGVEVEVPDLLGTGFGRAKTPQFVKPRITPLLERTSLPAVLAMLV